MWESCCKGLRIALRKLKSRPESKEGKKITTTTTKTNKTKQKKKGKQTSLKTEC